jgi:cytochrome P450
VLPARIFIHKFDVLTRSDWATIKPWEVFLPTVARITGRVLVGSELCRDPEWIGLTIQNTQTIMKHAMGIRAVYSKMWQWLAPWTYPGRHELPKLRERAAQLISPVLEKRLQAKPGSEKYRDAVQWLIDNAGSKPITAAEVSDALLFLFTAGIHSTSATLVSIVFDLLAHPEIIPELIEEIKDVQAESPEWTKLSLGKLRKMDSFMKESQRLHPVGFGGSSQYHSESAAELSKLTPRKCSDSTEIDGKALHVR